MCKFISLNYIQISENRLIQVSSTYLWVPGGETHWWRDSYLIGKISCKHQHLSFCFCRAHLTSQRCDETRRSVQIYTEQANAASCPSFASHQWIYTTAKHWNVLHIYIVFWCGELGYQQICGSNGLMGIFIAFFVSHKICNYTWLRDSHYLWGL